MTDKIAKNESDERPKSSIVERAARRVSSDLSADIASGDTPPGMDGSDSGKRPAGVIREPADPVKNEMLGELLPDIGSAEGPLVGAPHLEPGPPPEAASSDRSQLATEREGKGDANGVERARASFDINLKTRESTVDIGKP